MNPQLERLSQEIEAGRNNKKSISYNVKLSNNHISILKQASKHFELKQAEIIRLCIQHLPEIINKNNK